MRNMVLDKLNDYIDLHGVAILSTGWGYSAELKSLYFEGQIRSYEGEARIGVGSTEAMLHGPDF